MSQPASGLQNRSRSEGDARACAEHDDVTSAVTEGRDRLDESDLRHADRHAVAEPERQRGIVAGDETTLRVVCAAIVDDAQRVREREPRIEVPIVGGARVPVCAAAGRHADGKRRLDADKRRELMIAQLEGVPDLADELDDVALRLKQIGRRHIEVVGLHGEVETTELAVVSDRIVDLVSEVVARRQSRE